MTTLWRIPFCWILSSLALLAGAEVRAEAWKVFAMDNGVGRGAWTPERQATVLKELGFDGISYNYTTPADAVAWRRELAARDLAFYGLYFGIRLEGARALPAGLAETVGTLRGSGAVLWLVMPNPTTPGDYEDATVAVIREVADLAATAGLRVALYPHKDCYPATAEQALTLVERAQRVNVGLTVNLAHELAAGNGARLPGILRRVAPHLDLVTINGATNRPGPAWENYIKLLGDGEYDVSVLLRTLREIRYTGPVGIQFYNVKGDSQENLAATMSAWRGLMTPFSRPQPGQAGNPKSQKSKSQKYAPQAFSPLAFGVSRPFLSQTLSLFTSEGQIWKCAGEVSVDGRRFTLHRWRGDSVPRCVRIRRSNPAASGVSALPAIIRGLSLETDVNALRSSASCMSSVETCLGWI